VYSRKDENTYDYLNSYNDVLDWSERVKLLYPDRLRKLRIFAEQNRKKTEQKLKEIIEKREILYSVFTSIIGNKSADETLAVKFNNTMSETL
jgi:hypothetical protein